MKSQTEGKGIKEKIKWFNEHSPDYMAGHSNLYYWIHYPKALVKFLWLSRND